MSRLHSFLRDLFGAERAFEEQLDQIHKEQQKIMAALDDLKSAVADLGTSISNELAAISAKLSNPGGTSDSDIEAVVTQIENLKANVDQETATLTGTTPAPAPTA